MKIIHKLGGAVITLGIITSYFNQVFLHSGSSQLTRQELKENSIKQKQLLRRRTTMRNYGTEII
jgi:hypothetical protein